METLEQKLYLPINPQVVTDYCRDQFAESFNFDIPFKPVKDSSLICFSAFCKANFNDENNKPYRIMGYFSFDRKTDKPVIRLNHFCSY
jgi:hypothetical protein